MIEQYLSNTNESEIQTKVLQSILKKKLNKVLPV